MIDIPTEEDAASAIETLSGAMTCPHSSELLCTAYEWQTLLAGALALAIGGLTVFFLNRQIKQGDRHEASRIEKASLVVRARLAPRLSEISEITERNFVSLYRLLDAHIDEFERGDAQVDAEVPTWLVESVSRSIRENFQRVIYPVELTDILAEMFALTKQESVRDVLIELMNDMQVNQSRLLGLEAMRTGMLVTASNLVTYTLQACKIKSLTSSLFEFAWGKSDSVDEEAIASPYAQGLVAMELGAGNSDGITDVAILKHQLSSELQATAIRYDQRWNDKRRKNK